MKTTLLSLLFTFICFSTTAQDLTIDPHIYSILNDINEERLMNDVKTLIGFGTRHTMSDTVSNTRGIGAARRWIKQQFKEISKANNDRLEVYEQRTLIKADPKTRIDRDTWIVNIYAIIRGNTHPNRYIIMSGDIDSRISDVMNFKGDSPGANDNATGMAAAIELARVLAAHSFENSIILAGLSGEEQGLYGGKQMAEMAKEKGWDIIGVLNNDMIGNIEGIDGVIDNRTFRIFSEPYSSTNSKRELQAKRFYGGENDGISRQLARYVYESTKLYLPELNPMLIYRLDRFGRGGHHRPFNEAGFAGIRIMEAHENYNRQHQDIRVVDGIEYGDVIEGVDAGYMKKLTTVNAAALACLSLSPPEPKQVKIAGIVEPSAHLYWDKPESTLIKGYKLYWRDTTSPTWQYSKFVGDVDHYLLEGIVIDNFLFGVSSVGKNGHESVVSYPYQIKR